MTHLTSEVRAFLSKGTRTGKLGYVASDGRPLIAPVWFLVEGPDDDPVLIFNTGSGSAKGKAIARDPRLVICVDSEQMPFGFVQVQGVAELETDPAELLRAVIAISARYVPERAEEFGTRNAGPDGLLVRIRPTKIIAELDLTS